MNYKFMRVRKYYDAVRTNNSFLRAPINRKVKIFMNILKFFINYYMRKKPLMINNGPITAQIEPTSLCNLRCRMCIREKEDIPIGSMSFQDFKTVLDKLETLYKVGISGQGELFLNKDIFKMIDYSNKRRILVNVVSNGTLINKEIINQICRVNIGEIAVSIDSTQKRKYEKIRIKANFDEVTNNIKNLTRELKRRNKKTIVSIATIIFKDNFEEIPEFVLLAKRLGIKKIAFQTLQTKENYTKNYDEEIRAQTIKNNVNLKEKIEEGKKLAKKFGITLIFDEMKRLGCMWPWRGIYVNCRGDVTACCKILNYKNPELGNLLKQNFWEIWNSPNYQKFREYLRKRKVPYECCEGCNEV